jgi:photosystem II stability/assembly factor-like uncharacterized protein
VTSVQNLDGLLRWRNVGPFRGGRIVAVTGVYDDPNTFYFGAVAGGVWKSVDAGTYWRPVSDGFFNTSSIGALAVAPSDSNVLYAGTGETTIRIDVSHGDGVYKSTDAGNTWKHIGLSETRFIGKIRVHPTNPDILWVAALGHAFGPNSERGIYKSEDGGETWKHVLFVSDKAGAVDLTVDITNSRILYASVWEAYRTFWQISSGGDDSGIWRSTDGGETWEKLNDKRGLPKGTLGKIAVAASPAKSGRVWALIEHTKEAGLYRSDDYGLTWDKVSDNQNLVSRAWYYIHLTPDPVDEDTIYVNNLDFYKSTDGGRTFFEIPTPHGDNHDLWIDPKDNKRMIQGNDGGANVSLNGGYSFTSIFNQPTAQFYHISVDNKEPYNIYGTQQDNTSIAVPSRNNHGAISWQHCWVAGTGESGYIVPKPDDPDIVYVGAIGSSPGGGNSLQRYDRRTDQIRLITSWPEQMAGSGAGEWKQRFAWTYPIVISPFDPNTIFIGGDRVLKSTNEGQSWEAISPDLTRADPETLKPTGGPVNKDAIGAETYATVFSFIESPLEQGVYWAGSDDGVIHISKDSGATWTNVTPPQFLDWSLVSGIEQSPFDAATVYVAATRYKVDDFEPYLFVTRDYGQTWTRIDNGIARDHFTRVIRTDPTTPGLLYAGTEVGVYVSIDDGAHWDWFNANLPITPVHDLVVKDADLVAGTHGRSIWILDDLSPVRELARGIPDGNYLFAPRETKRVTPGIDWSGTTYNYINYLSSRIGSYIAHVDENGAVQRQYLDAGENPPRGAIITYRLAAKPAEPIKLIFKKTDGTEIATFTSRLEDDAPVAKELRAPAYAGWNRFIWDLRYAPVTKIKGNDPAAQETIPGPLVAPGTYTVTLKIGETELTQSFDVVKPSNLPATQEDLEAQEALLLKIHGQLERTTEKINLSRDLRAQLEGWIARTKDTENVGVAEAAEVLRDKALEAEGALLLPDLRAGWGDRNNNGLRLRDKLAGLIGAVNLGDYKPTDVAGEVFEDFTAKIEVEIAKLDALIEKDVKDFNSLAASVKLGAVIPE